MTSVLPTDYGPDEGGSGRSWFETFLLFAKTLTMKGLDLVRALLTQTRHGEEARKRCLEPWAKTSLVAAVMRGLNARELDKELL